MTKNQQRASCQNTTQKADLTNLCTEHNRHLISKQEGKFLIN